MRWPSSTPAGMRTLTERTLCSVPVPWHTGQGVSNSVPRPMQSGQTVLRENRPWLSLRLPDPPQRGQVWVEVPGAAPLPRQFEQRTSWGTLTDVVTPCTASWKDRWSCASMSAPRCGPRWVVRVRPAPPPKRPPKRSPRSPMSSMRKVPPPPPPGAAEAADRPVRADLVVLLALVGVADDVVGGADLLEALLRARVGVRVVLLRQLPVGARDLLVRRRRDDAEHLVVVLLEPFTLCGHGSVHPRTRTMAGRSTCPFQR